MVLGGGLWVEPKDGIQRWVGGGDKGCLGKRREFLQVFFEKKSLGDSIVKGSPLT